MCTLSFIPTEKGWVFTHNRDESVLRGLADAPELRDLFNIQAIWPIDPKGGGTWWAATSNNIALFLLNGGRIKHVQKETYEHSRGLLIPAFLLHLGPNDFLSNYSFQDIEPFTLVGIYQNKLFEIFWDGENAELNFLPTTTPKIWTSSTLYPPEKQAQREGWFTELQKTEELNAAELWKFHTVSKTDEKEFDIVMQRNEHLRTVSITQVECHGENLNIQYEDLERQHIFHYSFPSIHGN